MPVLRGDELLTLQEGEALRGGNMALIAAGTGLGQALLHQVAGRFLPSASEGGHADWAARNDREITVLRDVIARFGRAEVERVVSGQGFVNLKPWDERPGLDNTADVIAQRALAPLQIPVGLLTAVVGGAYLFWIVSRRRR